MSVSRRARASLLATPAWSCVAAALACLSLAGCDQFARVGVQASIEADASTPAPADGGGTALLDGDMATADGGEDAAPDASAACPEVEIAICNPMKNTGCATGLSMQCAIDLAATLTGYCIYNAPPALGMGGECLNTGITESCPATFTCYAASCRKICLCDAECGAGQCCTDPVERTGFRVCGDC